MNLTTTQIHYLTGIKSIDDEHQILMDQIEELHEMLTAPSDQKSVLASCNQLFISLRTHYDNEERLMLKNFFPDTEAHIGQHMNMIKMFKRFVQLVRDEDYETALSTLYFMIGWKKDHINDADRKYADFIESKSA